MVIRGDLSTLTPKEKVDYYREVCNHLGISPLTNPLGYIKLNGKLQLYPKKDATDQLRERRGISVQIISREVLTFGKDSIFTVVAKTTLPDGRTDESVGSVNVTGLSGDMLANAIMKAETKAKRRATLSICGLGWLDESEKETVPNAKEEPIYRFKYASELFSYALKEYKMSQAEVRKLLKANGYTKFDPEKSDEYLQILAEAAKDNDDERTDKQSFEPDTETPEEGEVATEKG